MDVNPVARGVLDAAADSSVPLEVRALENDCWRCGRASQVPIVVHPVGHTDAADLVWAMGDDTGIWYLKSLLTAARHPAAPPIRNRASKTAGGTYLSHGCSECDALFGAFWLEEATTDLLHRGLEHVPVLATLDRPLVEWWALICERGGIW